MSDKKILAKCKKKFTAVIIGAGRIAGGFDFPGSKEVLTHAHAYQKNSAVELVGVYDVDPVACWRTAKKWNIKPLPTLAALFAVKPDVISVCTPDATHAKVLRQLAVCRPRLVIVEKPLTANLKDSQRIAALFAEKKIPLLVNYSRRFDSTMQVLRRDIGAGRYGRILGGSGVYTKGLMHAGSHLIDLVRYLCGEVEQARPLFKRVDYHRSDPSIAAFLRLQQCPEFSLSVGDDRAYGLFEVTLMTERGRICLTNFTHTMSIELVKEDSRYPGFYGLAAPVIRPTRLTYALQNLVGNAVDYLKNKRPLLCSSTDALRTQAVCAVLLK